MLASWRTQRGESERAGVLVLKLELELALFYIDIDME